MPSKREPHPHVLGWGEGLPPVEWSAFLNDPPGCPVCGEPNGKPHQIITLGEAETWRVILQSREAQP